MLFKRLSEYFSKLEETSLRNKMTEILADLFKEAEINEIGNLCYLLQGRVASLYDEIEFGVADKMMIKAIAQGIPRSNLKSPKGLTLSEVEKVFKQEGDLGITVERIKNQESRIKNKYKELKIRDVYEALYKVAIAGGEGSQEEKIQLLGNLLRMVDPLSARYIVRIPLGKLRLGFSDMTILDSFSWMLKGSKELRPEIEKAYNVRPDLGFIGQTIKRKGVSGLECVEPQVGIPIRMAKADRLTSADEILKKIGKCAIESKYDGLRLQVHKKGHKIWLYSRNLENLTLMFPEIISSTKSNICANEAIFEGEIVAYNPQTGVSMPFQQTMQRRRKYNIAEKAAEIPVKLYTYELLLDNGTNYIGRPYEVRKARLKKIIKEDNVLKYAQETVTDRKDMIEDLFGKAVNQGYEGIIAKRLDGVYQAGMRGWNWIKFKKAMSKKLRDTFDVVVMGYTKGEGKRTSFGVGQFLTGIYDEKNDQFMTLTKIGTGLTDEQFRELKKRITKLEVRGKPVNYLVDKLLEADVWLAPSLVVEVAADEITRSQVHTAGRVMEPSKSGTAQKVKVPGFALRFPRLVRFRDDRAPQDTTTLVEIKKMYKQQGKT